MRIPMFLLLDTDEQRMLQTIVDVKSCGPEPHIVQMSVIGGNAVMASRSSFDAIICTAESRTMQEALDLLAEVRTVNTQVPFIIQSAFTDDETRSAITELGGSCASLSVDRHDLKNLISPLFP